MEVRYSKTTNTVSLGRKLTKAWAKRQIIYEVLGSLFLTGTVMIWLRLVIEQSWIWWTLFALMFITLTIVSIGVANRATGPSMMLDNSLDQSVEFLRDGIRYYKFKGMMDNLKYFFAVLVGKDEKIMHYYRYEDIEKVNVYANRKYMNVMEQVLLPMKSMFLILSFSLKMGQDSTFSGR